MPTLLFVLIVRLIVDVCTIVRKRRASRRRSQCIDCTHAHVQYATSGRTTISCTFAGTVRPIVIDVLYCTDYRHRNAAPRILPIGFVREIRVTEPLAEVAAVDK